jgi:hypothetical protein
MSKIYVAGSGITIPGGWPTDGRSINPVSPFHRNLVRDGDLIPKPTKSSPKKDDADGK